MYQAIFYILAAAAIISAIAMITRKNPMISAVSLVMCMLSIAGLFTLLAAPLIAAVQILISAGAVTAMFLFVIMMVDIREERERKRIIKFSGALGAIAVGYLVIVLVVAIAKPPFLGSPLTGESFEMPETLGRILVSEYAFPFELIGCLLLTAVVAAVSLVKENGRDGR